MEKFYQEILTLTKDILSIDSPTGYTKNIVDFLCDYYKKLCDKYNVTCDYEVINTGNLILKIQGETDYTVGLSAHVDTLGAMVCAINPNGTLKFDCLGGPILPTYDGEYCKIITRSNKVYQGTFLANSNAIHVHKDASTLPRNIDTMHIRIDEKVHNKNDVLALGIENGDFVAIDPKTVITDSGYIKSRFLDDKLSVGIIFKLLEYLFKEKITLKNTIKVIISTYEEEGFGSSYIPKVDELLAIDMGCVGLHLEGSEEKVSICAKDKAGPYNYEMTTKLINLAKEYKLDYCVDCFPYYSSDVSAALRGGNNIKGALIGSGVAASHGMERTHINGVINTFKLTLLYLTK